MNTYSGLGLALLMAGIVTLVTAVVVVAGVLLDRLAAREQDGEGR